MQSSLLPASPQDAQRPRSGNFKNSKITSNEKLVHYVVFDDWAGEALLLIGCHSRGRSQPLLFFRCCETPANSLLIIAKYVVSEKKD